MTMLKLKSVFSWPEIRCDCYVTAGRGEESLVNMGVTFRDTALHERLQAG